MLDRSRRRVRLPRVMQDSLGGRRVAHRHRARSHDFLDALQRLLCQIQAVRGTDPLSRFIEAVADGDVVDEPIIFTPETVSASIRTDQGERRVVATIPPGYDRTELVDELSRQGFEVEGRQ